MSADLSTEEPEDLVELLARLTSPGIGARQTSERWSTIYRRYTSGETLEELARAYGKHPSSIRRILLTAAKKERKKPGFCQLKSPSGLPVCDIISPMPHGSNPREWHHLRVVYHSNGVVGRCPVCLSGGIIPGGMLPGWRRH